MFDNAPFVTNLPCCKFRFGPQRGLTRLFPKSNGGIFAVD
jgi:hypothetical protein